MRECTSIRYGLCLVAMVGWSLSVQAQQTLEVAFPSLSFTLAVDLLNAGDGGKYIYADFLLGQGWALDYDGVNPRVNAQLFANQQDVATFGVDKAGELYFSNVNDGKIYCFAPPTPYVLFSCSNRPSDLG